eukprot:gnl/Trimastix_PCT/2160.p1 GENE.gnl/Trimastix_PCT/2160~~gnl/Trimastix_PCT/2160.p1  ORF type:complete len:401 (+),score=38.81 gnl/Trimastix_PCT/2160:67-1203(+)
MFHNKVQSLSSIGSNVSFNPYRTRLLTCSEQSITVLRKKATNWVETHQVQIPAKIHNVAWIHPIYGSAFLVADKDGSVQVWREDDRDEFVCDTKVSVAKSGTRITALSVAPHRFGTVFAACVASDADDAGLVVFCRCEEAQTGSLALTQWEVLRVPCASAPLSLAWSRPIGLGDSPTSSSSPGASPGASHSVLASAGCANGSALIYAFDVLRSRFYLASTVAGHERPIRALDWAPQHQSGTPQLLALGSADGTVDLWHITELATEERGAGAQGQHTQIAVEATLALRLYADAPEPRPEVLRLSFQPTGMALGVSLADCTVQLWRPTLQYDKWELFCTVRGGAPPPGSGAPSGASSLASDCESASADDALDMDDGSDAQ